LFGLTRKFIKKKRRPAVGATLPLKVAKIKVSERSLEFAAPRAPHLLQELSQSDCLLLSP